MAPFVYVQQRRYRSCNTAAAHLRAIQAFYSYVETKGLGIDETIFACHFESIRAERCERPLMITTK